MRVLCAPFLYVWCPLKNIKNPTSPNCDTILIVSKMLSSKVILFQRLPKCYLRKWYYSKWSQNVRMLPLLKRRHPAYVTLFVKSPFCPRCWKNLPHIVHHIYFWTTTWKHIIALPVFIGKPTYFRNGFNHTLHIEPIKRLLQAKHSGNN